jgi:hypothetical protein
MHKEILTLEQLNLFPLLRMFSNLGFFLVGGTAIALYLGHRRSIDFDLFTVGKFKKDTIINRIKQDGFKVERILYEDDEQLDMVVNDVKLTFLEYPFEVHPSLNFEQVIQVPPLVNLASMKAYALGRRAKWKDYVDLYFILKNVCSLSDLIENTLDLFGEMFNQKLFREQLSYFEDIDYSESIDYLSGHSVDDNSIREFLVMQATESL